MQPRKQLLAVCSVFVSILMGFQLSHCFVVLIKSNMIIYFFYNAMGNINFVFDFTILQGNLLFLKLNPVCAGQILHFPIGLENRIRFLYKKCVYTDTHIRISIKI